MDTNLKTENQTLHTHQTKRIAYYKPGTTIVCEQGVLWLTQSGKYKDYILHPGEQFVQKNPGAVVIEAFTDAVFSIN